MLHLFVVFFIQGGLQRRAFFKRTDKEKKNFIYTKRKVQIYDLIQIIIYFYQQLLIILLKVMHYSRLQLLSHFFHNDIVQLNEV